MLVGCANVGCAVSFSAQRQLLVESTVCWTGDVATCSRSVKSWEPQCSLLRPSCLSTNRSVSPVLKRRRHCSFVIRASNGPNRRTCIDVVFDLFPVSLQVSLLICAPTPVVRPSPSACSTIGRSSQETPRTPRPSLSRLSPTSASARESRKASRCWTTTWTKCKRIPPFPDPFH